MAEKKSEKQKTDNALTIIPKPGQSDEQAIADSMTNPVFNAAVIAKVFNFVDNQTIDISALIDSIHARTTEIKAGDLTSIEEVLFSQIIALQAMFTNLTKKAIGQSGMNNYQSFMTMAFKAQSQCRATVQALTELKYPRQVSFVKQANIANGPQQVNNEALPGSRAEELEASETNYQQIEDKRNEREELDFRRTTAASGKNQELATLGKVKRTSNSRRKTASVKKCL